jgi:hypothetical protein
LWPSKPPFKFQILIVVSSDDVARRSSLKGEKSKSNTAPLCPVSNGTFVGSSLAGFVASKIPTEPPPPDSHAIAMNLDDAAM